MSKKLAFRAFLDTASVLAMLMASGVVLWTFIVGPQNDERTQRSTLDLAGRRVSLEGVPSRGDHSARVGLVVFSDFECPYCGYFADQTQKDIDKQFIEPGHIQLFFRHLPLQIHANARRAAQIASCATQTGEFWKVHDALFSLKGRLTEPAMAEGLAGFMDEDNWPCTDDARSGAEQVDLDLALASELGIKSTPTFLIGTIAGSALVVRQTLVGSQPLERFTTAIEAAAKTATR